MRKWIAIAIFMASWCPQVSGQACQPLSSASIGLPNYVILMPNEVSGLTATFTQTLSGGTPSHRATAGQNTGVTYAWNSSGGVSAYSYVIVNNDGVHHPWVINTLSGSLTTTFGDGVNQKDDIYFVVVDQNGNSTQDHIHQESTGDPAGTVVFQDDFPTNYYLQFTVPFSGNTSMITTENCPGARNAIHSAPESGTFSNPTSGETQSFTSTGNSFCSNCAFSENSPPASISFLPGDAPPRTTTTDKLECSLAGPFLALIQRTGDSTQNQRIDKKMWTKVKIATNVQAGDGGWYTENWCIEKESPIWSPNELYTSLAPLNQYYWTAQTCSSSPPGTDPGPGWHCPGISGGPGPGNPEKFFASFSSVKGSCNTNLNTPAPY